jgi:hypothetical protein
VRERSLREAIKLTAAVTVGFAIILSPWFLRNFINHDTPTILMGKTAGYLNAQEDYLAFKNFYSLFLVDITPVYTAVAVKGETNCPMRFLILLMCRWSGRPICGPFNVARLLKCGGSSKVNIIRKNT